MMATTHALAGMVLVSVTALVAPEYAPVAVGGAAAGGIFPDLDLYGNHRRTLHYPVVYSVGAVPLIALAVLTPGPITVAGAAFVTSAAVHSVMDALGGGLELKPWQGTSDRAVYSHYHGRWLRPRRWIRYDGAPEDVAFASLLTVPILLYFTGTIRTMTLLFLGISVFYGLIRKPMVLVTEWLLGALPSDIVERLPDRFTNDFV